MSILIDTELLTVKEVSKILKVNVHRVYDLVRTGMLPALKLGSLKIRKSSLEKFIEEYEGMDISDVNNIKPLNIENSLPT